MSDERTRRSSAGGGSAFRRTDGTTRAESDADARRDVGDLHVRDADRGVTSYDLLLAAVPAPLVAGALANVLLAVPAVAALGVGSIGAAGVVGYSLFLHPP